MGSEGAHLAGLGLLSGSFDLLDELGNLARLGGSCSLGAGDALPLGVECCLLRLGKLEAMLVGRLDRSRARLQLFLQLVRFASLLPALPFLFLELGAHLVEGLRAQPALGTRCCHWHTLACPLAHASADGRFGQLQAHTRSLSASSS